MQEDTRDTRSLFPNPMTCILLCINVLQNIIMIIMEMGGAYICMCPARLLLYIVSGQLM